MLYQSVAPQTSSVPAWASCSSGFLSWSDILKC
jgi:hypothetical protein